ncbi:MAG: hypothetical protein KatS3mg053_0681 [Candidatus Roseilinea sp.]|nr:MAG: hypothetical protein KatS3mg053_0681 [Candidatus Roseilinea sp.]
MKNYYKLLQVDPSAEPEVITAAYRRLAMKYHPDTNGDSAEAKARMQALNEAYAVLSDPVRRAAYDRRLAAENLSPSPQPRSNEWSAPNATYTAPPPPDACEAEGRPINARSVVMLLIIAVALLGLVLLGFVKVGPLELIIVLVVSLLLVPPISAWLANRTRR